MWICLDVDGVYIFGSSMFGPLRYELPDPYSQAERFRVPEVEPAALLGPAWEFQEVFGTREEHFQERMVDGG